MAETTSTYSSMIKMAASQVGDAPPEIIFVLWFKVLPGTLASSGGVELVNTSHHPFDPGFSLNDLANIVGVDESWSLAVAWLGQSDNGKAPSPEQIQELIELKIQQLMADVPDSFAKEAMFDRKENRIDALDFSSGPAN